MAADVAPAKPRRRTLRIKPVPMGHKPGLNYDNIESLLEYGEGERVAALMYEHAYGTKASINMNRKTWRVGPDEDDTSATKQDPTNILQP